MNAIHKWDISITHSKAQGTSWKIWRKSVGAEGRKGQEGDQCGTISAQDTATVITAAAQDLYKIRPISTHHERERGSWGSSFWRILFSS